MDVPEIDVETLAEQLGGDTVLIDVREREEYDEGHVPGARLLPLGEIMDRVDEVPTDGPVLVICKSGGRSLRAAEFLIGRGVDATNVAGGTMAWTDSGRSVAEGSEPG